MIDGDNSIFGYVDLATGDFTSTNTTYNTVDLLGADGTINMDDIDGMTVDNEDVFWVASRDNSGNDPAYLAKMRHDGTFIKNAFGPGIDYIVLQGPEGFPDIVDAMAYDPIDDALYISANDGSGNPSLNNLMKINTSTGVAVLIGNMGVGDIEGLGFDGEGNMFATTGFSSTDASNRNSFYSINKETGEATKTFTFSEGSDYETCDCVIGDKNIIKGTVFFDADGSSYKTDDESGLQGVTVSLYEDKNSNGKYEAGTDYFIRSVVTNKEGQYKLFDAYDQGTVNYVITIDPNDLPSAYNFTTDNIEVASFSSGNNTDLYNDFGYNLPSVSNNIISGFVFADDDQNATKNGSEGGIENAKVYLYQDVDNDGAYTEGVDDIVSSANTGADGSYSFTRPFIEGTTLIEIQTASADDAEQKDGTMYLTSSDLDFGDKAVGVIYANANIPQGASIKSAYFTVVSSGSSSSTTNINLFAEDVNSASAYTTSSNNLTNRTLTSASKKWMMPYWSASGITFQSPDITQLVQEVVNRSGWNLGNDINIISLQSSGLREAVSHNTNSSEAPKLFVKYTDPSVADRYLTFVDVNSLPMGSSLTTDNIETASFTTGGNTDPNNNFGVYQDLSSFNTISGTVFKDVSNLGTLNSGDIGENNITVNLYNDVNANGIYDAGTDEFLTSKKTDASGNYIFQQNYTTSSGSISSKITTSSDDAIDDKNNNDLDITKRDLKLGKELVVVRFNDIDIPNGATITSAEITFTGRKDGSGNFSTKIEGIDTDNLSTFSDGDKPSDLTRTSASTTWSDNNSWYDEETYTSPSLVSIVTEIVNRPGWTNNNSIGFILDEGTGERKVEAKDGSSSKAPVLNISYTVSNVNYVLTIDEDNLPNGYTLTTDNIETATFNSGGNTDPNNNFGYQLDMAAINLITGTIFSDDNNNATFDNGETVVQDVTIRLYKDDNCNGVIDDGESIISTTTSNAQGEYSFSPSFNSTYQISKRVNSSSDDADDSPVTITSSDLDFSESEVALRFTNLDIPQGATISEAYIEVTPNELGSDDYNLTIRGIDVNNANTFSANQNFSSLPKTSASVNWSGTNDWQADIVENTPSVINIVQEIVNRNGWTSNNSMAFFFGLGNNGSSDIDAYSYNTKPSSAPRLVVSYTVNSSSTICYITEVVNSSIAQGGTLTTTSTQTASFNSAGNTDANNDYGIKYAALPVEMVYIKANWDKSTAKIDWATAAELNNDYFEVQWSNDGINFQTIGTVIGNGTSTIGHSYSFEHADAEHENYYRLKQIDFDGTIAYSEVVNLNKQAIEEAKIEAYPNPFSTQIKVSINSAQDEEATLQLISVQENVVYEQNVAIKAGVNSYNINNISQLRKGSYMLVLSTQSYRKTLNLIKR